MEGTRETWVGSLYVGRSPGGGDGNPLQYSCQLNPTDRGAWRATVHGVAKSWTDWVSAHTQTHPPWKHHSQHEECLHLAPPEGPAPPPASIPGPWGDPPGHVLPWPGFCQGSTSEMQLGSHGHQFLPTCCRVVFTVESRTYLHLAVPRGVWDLGS